jgi:hypothetical protein
MEQFLSNLDIKRVIPDVNIIIYSQLKNVKKIEDIIPHTNSKLCILYETEPEYKGTSIGHWVCLFNTNDISSTGENIPYVEFFDPYGVFPDDELVKTIYKGPRILDKLLLDFMIRGGLVQYNDYQFQDYGDEINTCGKHCVMRLKNSSVDIETYKKILDSLKPFYRDKTHQYDRIVTDFYNY